MVSPVAPASIIMASASITLAPRPWAPCDMVESIIDVDDPEQTVEQIPIPTSPVAIHDDVEVVSINMDRCCICFEEMTFGGPPRPINQPCRHLAFCFDCALEARRKCDKCPMCKADIKEIHIMGEAVVTKHRPRSRSRSRH